MAETLWALVLCYIAVNDSCRTFNTRVQLLKFLQVPQGKVIPCAASFTEIIVKLDCNLI